MDCKISDEKICFDIHIASSYGRNIIQKASIEVTSDYTVDNILMDTIKHCCNGYRSIDHDFYFLTRDLNETQSRINLLIENLNHIEHLLNNDDKLQSKVPNGFIWFDEDDTGGKYGAIYYNRQLSDIEISKYELTPAIIKKKQQQIIRKQQTGFLANIRKWLGGYNR